MPAVSVVIPVFNPGPSLARCLDSVRAQTLADIEIICVDDGSTDGTGRRLDEIAALDERVRVIHTENSGWPGTPRNIGIDAARGEFVHFVDNDDVLPPYALTALYAAAIADRADVVFGRPVSDFRAVNHAIYRADLRGVTLAEHPELAEALTPHRMFRRDFLNDHSIRFPEVKVPLEDHPFVLRAYVLAASITMLVDRPYYFYLRRAGSGRNAGDTALEIELLADPMRQVAAMLRADRVPAGLAELVRRREITMVVMSRLTAASFADADPAEQDRTIAVARQLLGILGGPVAGLGLAHRELIAALGDADRVRELVRQIRAIDLAVTADEITWVGDALTMRLSGGLTATLDGEPGGEPADIELSLVSRETGLSLGVTDGITVDERGRVSGQVRVDTAGLDDGVWSLTCRIRWEGVHLSRALTAATVPPPRLGRRGLRLHRSPRSGALAVDIGQTVRSLARATAPAAELELDGAAAALYLDLLVDGVQQAELHLLCDAQPPELISLRAPLTATGTGAVVRAQLPTEVPEGPWRMFLRLPGSAAGPAAELPWPLRYTGSWS